MLFQKIPGPFKRDPQTNKVVFGEWTSEALADLSNAGLWVATEKVDGTNIRILWDGHEVNFGGRTERAELPVPLLTHLQETFHEEVFEQTFGETPVVLFGEGYGGKIQGGGKYSPTQTFVGFDVAVNGKYLRPGDAEGVFLDWFQIPFVPVRGVDLTLWEAIDKVEKRFDSAWEGVEPEGLVLRTRQGLQDHRGNRLIVKIKGVDFR